MDICRILMLFSYKLEFMWPITIATECLIVHKILCFEFIKLKKTCLVEITLAFWGKKTASK